MAGRQSPCLALGMLAGQGRREGCFGKASTALSGLPGTWGQVHQPISRLAPYHPSVPRMSPWSGKSTLWQGKHQPHSTAFLHDRQEASSGSSPMRGPGAQNHTGADKLPPSYSASCHLTCPCTPIPPAAMSSFCSCLLSHAPDLVSKIPIHPPPKATAHEAQDLLRSPQPSQVHELLLSCPQDAFHMLSGTRPEAPSTFATAVHDCAGVHRARQHPHGPSTSSRAATGTVKEEGSGQPCPLLQHPSWQHTDTCPASSSGLQDTSPRPQCRQHPVTTAGQVLGDPPTFTQPNPRATWLLPALSHKPHSLHPDVPWCCAVQEEPPVAPAHSQPTLMSSQPGWCPQDVTSILTLNLKCHLFTPTPCCTFVRAQPSRATPPAQPNLSWATERWPKAKATLPGQHLPEEHAPGTDLSRCSPCQDP